MEAETTVKCAALEKLAARMRSLFMEAGFEAVSPAILQPADLLLDCLGEALRARAYVFTDPDGEELCLRPDLTMPTARLYLERSANLFEEARYCYNGPAFRYSPGDGKGALADESDRHGENDEDDGSVEGGKGGGEEDDRNGGAREFYQSGIEIYAAADPLQSEVEILRLILNALEDAGLARYKIKIGDVSLFSALIDALDMPQRWRERLKHHFWRKDSFQRILQELASESEARHAQLGAWPQLDPDDPAKSREKLKEFLEKKSIPLIGVRTIEEICSRLLDMEQDLAEPPLPAEAVSLIEDYLKIKCQPGAILAKIDDLAENKKVRLDRNAVKNYRKRLELIKKRGIDTDNMKFYADFGREFEYYTGFVFQIEVDDDGGEEDGEAKTIALAGGGRYDNLLGKLGAFERVPAVGCAIDVERLLAHLGGDAQ
jgi:ATP phosphoribosyltransferase regulatory subunit